MPSPTYKRGRFHAQVHSSSSYCVLLKPLTLLSNMLLQYLLYTLSLGSPALARTLSPSFAQGVQRRQALANYDPEDLSSIKKLAAIGDSYSAGIGAGERLGNPFSDPGAWACTSPFVAST